MQHLRPLVLDLRHRNNTGAVATVSAFYPAGTSGDCVPRRSSTSGREIGFVGSRYRDGWRSRWAGDFSFNPVTGGEGLRPRHRTRKINRRVARRWSPYVWASLSPASPVIKRAYSHRRPYLRNYACILLFRLPVTGCTRWQ